MARYNKNIII